MKNVTPRAFAPSRLGAFVKMYFVSFLVLMSTMLSAQQVLVNKVWDVSFGNPGPVDWSATTVDPAGNLITTGNTVVSSTQIAALITKQDQQGNILWQQNFTIAPNSQNYGIAVCTDQSGYIYVAGACQTGLVNRDVLVLKYDPSGGLVWSQTYGSSNQQDDGAVAITCDPNGGQIFVTGPSMGSLTQFDYLTLALDGANGTVIWNQRYNGPSSLPDVPIGITFDNGDVNIIGASGANTNQYDVTTLRYSYTGSLVDSVRYSLAGTKIDQPTAITKDLVGNLYITGSSTTNGTNYDMQTMKINVSDLSIAWVKTYDLNGLEDKATSVCVNAQGEVFITGYATLQTGKTVMTAIKYAANSTQEWVVRLAESKDFARGQRCTLDPSGNLTLAGVSLANNTSTWLTYLLEPIQGNIRFERELQSGNNLDFQPNDIRWVNADGFVVSGRSASGYRSVYYERFVREDILAYDSLGQPSYASNQLIVNFRSELLNKDFIDDRGKSFAKMNEVFPDSFLLDPRINFDVNRVRVIKIYRWMTSADSLSITRLGDTIEMPKFWSSLLFIFYDGFDIQIGISNLQSMGEFVNYVEKNWAIEPCLNDPLYPVQLGINNINSLASINVEQAWELETGTKEVRVSINGSSMVYFPHEDFADAFGAGNGRIIGGYNYSNGISLFDMNPEANDYGWNHETSMAGIIASNRNNSIGIAGIAGGGGEFNGVLDQGVSLISSGGSFALIDVMYSALVQASYDSSDPASTGNPLLDGYACDVINAGWVTYGFPGAQEPLFVELRKAVTHCYRNGCVVVAPKGGQNIVEINYPADIFYPERIIAVGASGMDGRRASVENLNLGNTNPSDFQGSSFSTNTDILAPGVYDLVTSTVRDLGLNDQSGEKYAKIAGTSASTAMVSGVSALLISLHRPDDGYPNYLAPEDVEYLLKTYATDILTDENEFIDIGDGIGDDAVTGSGLLNAGLSLQMAHLPEFCVLHSESFNTYNIQNQTLTTVFVNQNPTGAATEERVEIVRNITGTIDIEDKILSMWGRNSSSIGSVGAFPYADGSVDVESTLFDYIEYYNIIYSNNTFSFSAKTHLVKLTSPTGQVEWFPFPPSQISTPFSLHVQHDFALNATNIVSRHFSISPNPAINSTNLSLVEPSNSDVSVILSSLDGKTVHKYFIKKGEKDITIDLSSLIEGMYICTVSSVEFTNSVKIIKTR